MPEGHSIHRHARMHRELLGGRTVAAWSPQGRFAAGARALDGAVLVDTEAHGKHLFYRFAASPGGDGVGTAGKRGGNGRRSAVDLHLHVHLGLFGHFRQYEAPADPPSAGTRLVLNGGDVELQLSAPVACELIDPDAEALLRGRLGPDPLRGDDPEPAFAALRRRRAPIAQALLDQQVVAGIGNVYRAEVLFLAGVHPQRRASDVDRDTFDRMWRLVRRLMRDGERRGTIITVQPADRARPPSRLRPDERLYVYKRQGQPCRRCGTAIRAWPLAARIVYACPVCQPS